MECDEVIYEALGEVSPMKLKKTDYLLAENNDDNSHSPLDDVSNMQSLLSQGITDDALVDYIFNSCDVGGTGLVEANELINFIVKAFNNNEFRDELVALLHPITIYTPVDVETFQQILKSWISKMDLKSDYSLSELHASINVEDAVGNEIATSNHTSDSSADHSNIEKDLNKELQYQCEKLQEENQLLQEQVMETEDSNKGLQSENMKLKTKISRFDSEVISAAQQVAILQEEKSDLQNQLLQAKDDLQKLTKLNTQCKKELEANLTELDLLRQNFYQEEDRSKTLQQTILTLEDLILSQEKALQQKDDEVQSLAKDLMEHQLTSDHSLTSSLYSRRAHNTADTLASELQASFTPIIAPWKSSPISESATGSEFFHPASWNIMINEPEYEEKSEIQNVSKFSTAINEEKINSLASNKQCPDETKVFEKTNSCNNQSTPKRNCSFKPQIIVDDQVEISKATQIWSLFPLTPKLFAIILMMICVFTITSCCLMLLSQMIFSDCSVYNGLNYYHSSPWTKVIALFQPYCLFEYDGHPPV